MSFTISSSLHYSFRNNVTTLSSSAHQQPPYHQMLKLRFGHCSRLVSRSPISGIISDRILQQTPSSLLGEALFPFPMNNGDFEEEERFFSHFWVIRFLSSFNLRPSVCELLFERISDFAQQLVAADVDSTFLIEADIDFIKILCMDDLYSDAAAAAYEYDIPASRRGAPESAIERLKNQKLDGVGEGDCSVCFEDLKESGEEVAIIPCGHVYHKSCILTWLHTTNSCPLCRASLQP